MLSEKARSEGAGFFQTNHPGRCAVSDRTARLLRTAFTRTRLSAACPAPKQKRLARMTVACAYGARDARRWSRAMRSLPLCPGMRRDVGALSPRGKWLAQKTASCENAWPGQGILSDRGQPCVHERCGHASGRFPYGAVLTASVPSAGTSGADNRRFFEHSAERRTFFCTVSKEHS